MIEELKKNPQHNNKSAKEIITCVVLSLVHVHKHYNTFINYMT